jgi:hypothetical protein
LPLPFLLGVGIPAEVGESVWATSGAHPAPYCFISHSTADRVFVDRLVSDLKNNEVHCWYFPENATWGRPVWEEIGKGISTANKVIVVCSKNSLNSGPVLRELERTLQREDSEQTDILLPVCIDDHVFHGWNHPRQPDVVAKVVGDLRGWDLETTFYKAGVDRLLEALRRR